MRAVRPRIDPRWGRHIPPQAEAGAALLKDQAERFKRLDLTPAVLEQEASSCCCTAVSSRT